MQPAATDTGSTLGTPDDAPTKPAGEEPQTPARERSGILGEPAGTPPGTDGTSEGDERTDPIHTQVPQDGVDHWRR